MLSKLTRGNQITIPKQIVDKIGLKCGVDYVDVEYVQGIIRVKPVEIEERIPAEALEKLAKKSLAEEEGDVTLNAKEAETFLVKLARKSGRNRK